MEAYLYHISREVGHPVPGGGGVDGEPLDQLLRAAVPVGGAEVWTGQAGGTRDEHSPRQYVRQSVSHSGSQSVSQSDTQSVGQSGRVSSVQFSQLSDSVCQSIRYSFDGILDSPFSYAFPNIDE